MPWIRVEHAKVAMMEAVRGYVRMCGRGGMTKAIQDHVNNAISQAVALNYVDLSMAAYAVPDRDPKPKPPQHDTLRDNVGQAIHDVFTDHELKVDGLDIHDAREIDIFTDAVMPLIAAEHEKLIASSITLNRIVWDAAEKTGQVPLGSERAELDPQTVINEALRLTLRKANDDAIERCVRNYAANSRGNLVPNVMYDMTRYMADGERAKALNALIDEDAL